MGMGTNVGIQTESHASYLILSCCQFVDNFQFRNALNVETEDVVVQSEIDFPIALADAGIDDLAAGKP